MAQIEETQIRVPKYLATMLKNVATGSYANNLQALIESQNFIINDENIALLQTQHAGIDLNDAVRIALDTQEAAEMQREADEVNGLEKSVKALYRPFREKGFNHKEAVDKSNHIVLNAMKATQSPTDLVSLLVSVQTAIIFNKKENNDVRK